MALTLIFPSRIRSIHPASIFYPDCGRTMKTLFPSTSEMYIIFEDFRECEKRNWYNLSRKKYLFFHLELLNY